MITKENWKKVAAVCGLGVLILWNMHLHAAELTIRSDVNDNSFQAALVDDASKIVHQIVTIGASPFYLFDSHNERWNEGFALSSYYSHLPQDGIAITSLLTHIPPQTLFSWLKFIFLISLPVTFFIAALILGQSYLFSFAVAYISHIIFTDGLYGIDIASYLWRGWGLSSQLFAIFFMPLAFAYTYVYLTKKKHLGYAVLFNFILASCHSGVFLMMALSYPIMVLVNYFYERKTDGIVRAGYFVGFTGLFLAYFFIPFFTQSNFRNFSYWDPIWKFNSYGIIPIVGWLLNGQLFDFNRFPAVTLLAIFGFLYGFLSNNRLFQIVSLMFAMSMCLFIGTAPFGPIIKLIPGLSEFHLHRFIVAVQFTGVLLAAYMMQQLYRSGKIYFNKAPILVRNVLIVMICIAVVITIIVLEKPIIQYAGDNSTWIRQGNIRYDSDIVSYQQLIKKVEQYSPNRIYAGRPGNWGRDLKVGDTPVYMKLAQDGYRTISYSPESWSPNSESDQFFNDTDISHFILYNIQLAVYPESVTPPSFAEPIATYGKYHLYRIVPKNQIPTLQPGWFTFGKSSLIFIGKKYDFVNVTHLWMYSKMFGNQNYPQVLFKGDKMNIPAKYYYYLNDLNHYTDNNGKPFSLWQRNPVMLDFGKAESLAKKIKERVGFQKYSVDYSIQKNCTNCVVILKQTYHPNWRVTVNGESVQAYPVFPFYIGISVEKAGNYHIEATYKPNTMKVLLIILNLIVLIGIGVVVIKGKMEKKRKK